MLGPPAPQAPRAGTDHAGEEKRTAPRHSCRRLVRVRRAMAPGAPSRLAILENVSTQGIGLLLTEPVPPETVLEIEMHGQSIVKRFARVVHSTKQADGWLVGCALNNSLSNGELERLLLN
jgi:hypothetical protein